MEIITLADYKTFANITSPNQDSQLSPLVAFVNQFVSDYLGISSSFDEYLENTNTLLLPSTQSVLSISGSVYIDNEYYEDLAITNFIQVGFKVIFTKSITGKITITLSDKTINNAVKEACNLLVKHYSKEEYKSQIQSGAEQIQVADVKALPIHIKTILDLYRES